jgi:hypothetical protein
MHASLVSGTPSTTTIAAPCVNLPQQQPAMESRADHETKRAIRELLDVLPKDVLDELNGGTIDLKDPAFLDGLTDHVARLSIAAPKEGQRILGKVIRLKKLISRSVRESDPEVAVSTTISRTGERIGRNAPCPCGSGRKYKQCCLRKQ